MSRRAETRYLKQPGDPALPRPADMADPPDGTGPTLSSDTPVPASLADDKDWLELARLDRALAKLAKAFDRRLGEDSEATAYLADARTALYDAGQAFARECPPRTTQEIARAISRARRLKP